MKIPVLLAALALLPACNNPRPIRINSDPNQEAMDRMHDKMEEDDIELFIRKHADLDDQTKRELRDGTISRSEAARRARGSLKYNPPQ